MDKSNRVAAMLSKGGMEFKLSMVKKFGEGDVEKGMELLIDRYKDLDLKVTFMDDIGYFISQTEGSLK